MHKDKSIFEITVNAFHCDMIFMTIKHTHYLLIHKMVMYSKYTSWQCTFLLTKKKKYHFNYCNGNKDCAKLLRKHTHTRTHTQDRGSGVSPVCALQSLEPWLVYMSNFISEAELNWGQTEREPVCMFTDACTVMVGKPLAAQELHGYWLLKGL